MRISDQAHNVFFLDFSGHWLLFFSPQDQYCLVGGDDIECYPFSSKNMVTSIGKQLQIEYTNNDMEPQVVERPPQQE